MSCTPTPRYDDVPARSDVARVHPAKPARAHVSDRRRSVANLASLVLLGLAGFEVALSQVFSSLSGH